jgi:4-azaleucine resistance transporter AzlC
MMSKEPSLTFLQGIKDCVPTLLGYVGIGFAAGIVANAAGLSIAESGLLAALVYAGAAQFIFCAMLMSLSPATAIVLTTFVVNLRHFLMSASMAPHFASYPLWKNIGIGALLTDETFGVASTQLARGLPVNDRWMYGLNLTAYVTWIFSCVAGGWLGSWIQDPEAWGLDFALPAMFVALLILQLDSEAPSKLKRYLLLIAVTIALMLLFSGFMSTHMAVLISTIMAAALGAVMEK